MRAYESRFPRDACMRDLRVHMHVSLLPVCGHAERVTGPSLRIATRWPIAPSRMWTYRNRRNIIGVFIRDLLSVTRHSSPTLLVYWVTPSVQHLNPTNCCLYIHVGGSPLGRQVTASGVTPCDRSCRHPWECVRAPLDMLHTPKTVEYGLVTYALP